MSKKYLSDSFIDFIAELRKYLEERYDLAKLEITEKLAMISAFFISTIISLFIISAVIFFLLLALGIYLGQLWNDYALSFLLVAGVVFVFGIIFIALKRNLFVNPVLKTIIRVFFREAKTEEDNEH